MQSRNLYPRIHTVSVPNYAGYFRQLFWRLNFYSYSYTSIHTQYAIFYLTVLILFGWFSRRSLPARQFSTCYTHRWNSSSGVNPLRALFRWVMSYSRSRVVPLPSPSPSTVHPWKFHQTLSSFFLFNSHHTKLSRDSRARNSRGTNVFYNFLYFHFFTIGKKKITRKLT